MNYFTCLVIFLWVAKGSALTCYNCTWNDMDNAELQSSKSCQGPIVGSEHVITCPVEKPYCYTQNVHTVFEDLNVDSVTIVRSCSEFDLETCIDLKIATTCTKSCTTDLCNIGNNGAQLIVNFSLFIFSVLSVVLLQ